MFISIYIKYWDSLEAYKRAGIERKKSQSLASNDTPAMMLIFNYLIKAPFTINTSHEYLINTLVSERLMFLTAICIDYEHLSIISDFI